MKKFINHHEPKFWKFISKGGMLSIRVGKEGMHNYNDTTVIRGDSDTDCYIPKYGRRFDSVREAYTELNKEIK